jgi:hypothetical protein
LFGNPSKADATRAQLDELLNRFLIFHKTFLHPRSLQTATTRAVSNFGVFPRTTGSRKWIISVQD